jgi:hypothetical protein
MRAPRQRGRRAAVSATAGAAGLLALIGPAVGNAAPAGIVFHRAVNLRLPGARFPALNSASCGAAGSCSLAGEFTGRSGASHMMVITRSDGRWGSPTKLQLPLSSPPGFTGTINSISCTRVGSCVAVGSYGGARTRGFAATESHGKWRPAVQLRRPSNAGAKFSAFILGVACTGPGKCVAGGNYSETSGHHAPMVVTEVNGRWQRGQELRPPPNATIHQPVILTGLACPALGSCVAVGVYADKAFRPSAFAATESGGTWHQAVQLVMPKDANTKSPLDFINSVACSGVGSCVVVGSYVSRLNGLLPMSVTESGGTWQRAQHVTRVPVNATAQPRLTFRSVSCLAHGTCLAVGEYRIRSGGVAAMVMTKSGNRWTSATQIVTPPNGPVGDTHLAQAVAIGCSASGFCAIGGSYGTIRVQLPMAATS